MGWLEMLPLMAAFIVVAVAAAAGGFWASVVVRRRKPRARGPFMLGVLCGVMVGAAVTGHRRGLTALGSSTLKILIRPRLVDDFRKHCLTTVSRMPWPVVGNPSLAGVLASIRRTLELHQPRRRALIQFDDVGA